MIAIDAVKVGDAIPAVTYGPLTIQETVRWAGVQENSEQVHWDREFARTHSKLPTFIASGAYRQALLARTLTDWVGPNGRLRRMKVRHTAPWFEGDTITISGRVSDKQESDGRILLLCEIEGQSRDSKQLLVGQCTLTIASRAAPAATHR